MTQSSPSSKRQPSRELSAVTRAFLENSAFLHAFLRRFLSRRQDIEDVAQEAYLKAYSSEQGRDIEHAKSYLFTIAKNLAINELSRKSNRIVAYIEECKTLPQAESSPTVEDELEAQQSLGIYCEAVASLPEKCRRVFLLRRVHGLKQQEIADTLGISLRTVEKHLHQGTQKCRAFVSEARQGETHLAGKSRSLAAHKEGQE